MRIFVMPKYSIVKVSENFSFCEYDCPCTYPNCTQTIVYEELSTKVQKVRDTTRFPVKVHGFRCTAHQEDLKKQGYETAKGTSSHELGMAADISCGAFSGKMLADLAQRSGFQNIGIAGSWIHADVRPGGPRSWEYKVRK